MDDGKTAAQARIRALEQALEAARAELYRYRTQAQRTGDNLRERVKELSCLYAISSLLQAIARPLEQVMPAVLKELVGAYRYPEIACARLLLEGQTFHTEPFAESPWRQTVELKLEKLTVGTLEVFYREERPAADQGPFLREERHLLETVAGLLGHYLENRRERCGEQAARQESESRYRRQAAELDLIYRTAPVGLAVMDERLRYVRVNERLAEMNGIPVAAHLGKSVWEVVPRLAPQIEGLLRRILESGEPVLNFEVQGETPVHPGETRYWIEHWLPLKDEEGRMWGANVVVEDITEHKRLEETREREHRFRTLAENSTDVIVRFDRTLRRIYANPAFESLLGRPLEAVLGKTNRELGLPPELADLMDRHIERTFTTGITQTMEVTLPTPQGERVFDSRLVPERGAGGAVETVLGISRDITDRKRAEEALRESEQRLQLITDGLPMLIAYVDTDERYRFANAAYGRWFGGGAAVLGRRIADVVGAEIYARINTYIRCALSGERVRYSATLPYRSGEKVVDVLYIPHLDANGRVLGFYGLIQDVSELSEYKRVVEELRRSNTLLERVFENVHVLLAYLDPAFHFIRVNRAYAEIEGRAPEFFVDKNHFELYPSEENEAVFRRVVATGEPYTVLAKPFEYAGHPERGVTYWDWSLQPIKGQSGRVEGLVFLLVNVTEKMHALQRLEQTVAELSRNAALMSRAEVLAQLGYWREELDSGEARWSDGMYRLFGLDPGQAREPHRLAEAYIHPDDLPRLRRLFESVREGKVAACEQEYRVRRADTGEEHVLFVQGELESDAAGRRRLFGIAQDVTERKRREWALRERFRLMAEVLEDVVWVAAPAMREVLYVNPAYGRVWGRNRLDLYTRPEAFFDTIHPQDRESLRQRMARTAPWEADYRILDPDGTERWLHGRSVPLRDEQGRARLIVHLARDITDRKRAEEVLRRREREFEVLVERSPDIIARVDRTLRLRYVNPAVERVSGRPREWFLNKTPAEQGLAPQETEQRERVLKRVLDSGQEQVVEQRNPSVAGERYFQSRLVPEFGADGTVESVLVVDRDITDLKRAQHALERMTLEDPLTGIANRRYLEQFIEREWGREARHRHPVALIMVDIDHFKAYNDRYGHQLGDECLRRVAQALKSHLRRPTDFLVRYGGEEFAVVLLETDLGAALGLARAMHRAVADLRLPHAASPVAPVVTCSLGVAAEAAHRIGFAELLRAADAALYQAKRLGRNRIEVAGR